MNAVSRQRRANALRIAQAAVDPVRRAGVGVWAKPGPEPRRLRMILPTAVPIALAPDSEDRADAVSGSPVAIDLLGTGTGAGVRVSLFGRPRHGRVVLSDDATAVYTSAPGFTGTDSFGYRLTDEDGRVARVTVAVSVAPVTEPGSAAPGAEPASGFPALAYAA